ncbi:hypothetical protein [Methanobrevibacter olleyae]|uniref:Uncharacterized protein n=1 Tax=Methanobrevibacter olleyae TaxID=294671 RepID=A0A126R1L5_METOL|nr:hypothetical protein [Methanobrevibacter olleyae]AMK16283.1 hypothetical protein YLM1_1728 [Methanobrevibacter olleyae]
MFFKNKELENIDSSINYEELEEYAKERGIPYYNEDVSSLWNVYAQKYGYEHGLTHSEQLSFGYMCSSIFGGMGYSCSTEVYYKEEEIFDKCMDALSELNHSGLSEKEVMKELFDYIFILYHDKIEDYTFKTEKLNIKTSLSMMEHLENVPGENKSEKFREVMKAYRERINK